MVRCGNGSVVYRDYTHVVKTHAHIDDNGYLKRVSKSLLSLALPLLGQEKFRVKLMTRSCLHYHVTQSSCHVQGGCDHYGSLTF